VPTVLKSGSLNLLETGHVQACRGITFRPPPVGSAKHLYVHSPTDHTEIEYTKMNYVKFSKPFGAKIAKFLANEFESEIQPKRYCVLQVNYP